MQLRAVAPLIVTATKKLLGPVLLATNGVKTVAIASTEVLRTQDAQKLSIATSLDGSSSVRIASWGLGRYSGIGVIELAGPVSAGAEVAPLPLDAICATVETRGAPAAIVTITGAAPALVRELIAVHVDQVDTGGGMSDDVLTRLASPLDPADEEKPVEGAVLFAWFPPDPVLGRKSEVLAVAMAYPYHQAAFQPRATRAFAELIGLDDLGRALIATAPAPAAKGPAVQMVTGEIEQHDAPDE